MATPGNEIAPPAFKRERGNKLVTRGTVPNSQRILSGVPSHHRADVSSATGSETVEARRATIYDGEEGERGIIGGVIEAEPP